MRSKLIVIFYVFALTLGLLACSLVITPPPQRSPNGVIFSAEQSEEALPWLVPQAEGSWTPTDADVAALEADLLPFLHTAENPWLRPDPPSGSACPTISDNTWGSSRTASRSFTLTSSAMPLSRNGDKSLSLSTMVVIVFSRLSTT
jgi:hypothetical protein